MTLLMLTGPWNSEPTKKKKKKISPESANEIVEDDILNFFFIIFQRKLPGISCESSADEMNCLPSRGFT